MTAVTTNVTERSRSGVLVVHAADEAYGADRVLLDLVLGLRALGWRIEVLLPDDLPPGWLSSQLAAAGIAVRRGPLAPARRRYLQLLGLPFYAVALLRARRFIRQRADAICAEIVHVNTSALLVGAILGRPAGARLVWHVHEIVVQPRLIAWLFRRLPTLRAERVIAVSDAVRSHLLSAGGPADRVVTIRNGLGARDPAPRPALAGAGPLVVFLGRLNRWKGHEAFIEAAGRAAERAPEARFVIAGDAPPGEAWREADADARIAATGRAEQISRLGFVDDGAAVLDAADVVVAPSTWPDPFPTVILEA
ncbi:MAG: glycosyltransferase, partial [Chloroflexi bacterium]|nr:glycosyltransferase [Chloroflexota bacterium]